MNTDPNSPAYPYMTIVNGKMVKEGGLTKREQMLKDTIQSIITSGVLICRTDTEYSESVVTLSEAITNKYFESLNKEDETTEVQKPGE